MLTLREASVLLSHCTVRGDANVRFERVVIDSRTVNVGDLFVAIKGERFDAHDFLPDVVQRGAAAALVAPHADVPAGLNALVVPDPRRALGELAAIWRARFKLPVAVVTGSNGKTTTKEMIAAIFRAAVGSEAVLATTGNLNNDIGLPLTLLRLSPAHRLAVIELGMNHPGETAKLAALVQPTIALVNNAQREHQEFMVSVEAVAREHADAIRALPANGVAVFPGDDPLSDVWREAAGTRCSIEFGSENDPPVSMRVLSQNALESRISIGGRFGELELTLPIPGLHNARNAAAAAAVALAAGLAPAAIRAGLEGFSAAKGRMQAVPGLSFRLIDDSYNANPDSVRAAIDVLASVDGQKVLVLGDMGEVGDQGPAFHAEVGAHAAARRIDVLVTLGQATMATHTAYQHALPVGVARHVDTPLAAAQLVQRLDLAADDAVLVKGSRFMAMERVVQALKAPAGETQC
jgi:UDP-N-acetylmuramoyl-tripeptide--D-alanyl-D-alanine ligase